MKHYTSEELGQKFRFSAPTLFLRALGALILARIVSYSYCTIPSLAPIVHGLAALWCLFALLTGLSAYSNYQRQQPAIGPGEGRMILVLATIMIIWAVGYAMELERGLVCEK